MQNSTKSVWDWLDEHRDVCFDLLRIYLGVGLLIKGIYFFLDQDRVLAFMKLEDLPFFPYLVIHYVVLAHIAGGFMLTIGLLTRLAALVQIPVVLGAIFFVHGPGGLFTLEQTLEFALLVLFLLTLFVVYGGGRLSADALLFKR